MILKINLTLGFITLVTSNSLFIFKIYSIINDTNLFDPKRY